MEDEGWEWRNRDPRARTKGGVARHRFVQREPNQPSEHDLVAHMFHKGPLAADGIVQLQREYSVE